MIGKVKWFNSSKGYGFICNDEGKDVFVHYSQILSSGYRTLQQGQQVSFDQVMQQKGLQAHHVTVQQEETGCREK